MISHTSCDHESTSSARAKCRRRQANGDEVPETRATPQHIDFSKTGSGPKASTPRDKDMQCDVCGVERIALRGTDPLTNRILHVGEKCAYMLKQSLDTVALG